MIIMTDFVDPLGEIVICSSARQYMSALLIGFGVFAKDSLTCNPAGLGIEPCTLSFVKVNVQYLFL